MNLRLSLVVKLVLMAILLGMTNLAIAQSVKAKVKLQSQRLQPEDEEILLAVPRIMEDYINSYTWADQYPNIVVDARITFIIETVTKRGSEKRYRGQIVASSPGSGTFVDKAVDFPFIEGQFLEHDRSLFNSLLSLVDFYVYMIIASELDTYQLKGGTKYFDMARNIADEGVVSNSSFGWKRRLEEVLLITDGDHIYLRDALFYFYEGLFWVEDRKDETKAPNYALKVVDLLDQMYRLKPNSKALKRFYDGHYQDFCILFSFDKDRVNMQNMARIDNRHSETYLACKSKIARQR